MQSGEGEQRARRTRRHVMEEPVTADVHEDLPWPEKGKEELREQLIADREDRAFMHAFEEKYPTRHSGLFIALWATVLMSFA